LLTSSYHYCVSLFADCTSAATAGRFCGGQSCGSNTITAAITAANSVRMIIYLKKEQRIFIPSI